MRPSTAESWHNITSILSLAAHLFLRHHVESDPQNIKLAHPNLLETTVSRYSQRFQTLLLLLTTMLSVTIARGDDWPQWRGPNHNDTVSESSRWNGNAWPPGNAIWSTNVNSGGSGPIVIGRHLYTMGWKENHDHVYCLDAISGREIWSQSYPCPKYGRHSEGDKGLYSGPSSCPSFDTKTGFLYTLSTDGDLNCWDTNDSGKRVWSLNFYDVYQVPQRTKVGKRLLRDYGYTTAPLIQGETIIVEVGDDEGNLMAFSKRTGKRRWTSESKDPAGHTGGIVPMVVDGLPCVAVLTIRNLLVVRLDENHQGETVAKFPWVTDFANNVATPTVLNNSVIMTSEYNQYSIVRIDITRSGAKQVWKQPYASGLCPPVIYNGHVYWCWRGVYCLNFATGKPIWRGGRGYGDAASCIATSDGRLIIWGRRGDLALVETADHSPKKYSELARKKGILKNDVWPHIVLSGGRLYCKDRDGNMVCFSLF
jgi:outer membrane protein assembly factor BamB